MTGEQGVGLWGGNPGRGPTSRHFRFYRHISGHGTIFPRSSKILRRLTFRARLRNKSHVYR